MAGPRPRFRGSRTVAWLLGVLCLVTWSCRAATPVIEATIEPSLITVGQSAQLTITTSGSTADAIKLPEVNGLEMRAVGQSRRIQIINGAMLSSTSLIVRVTPQAPGIYMIPGITQQPLELRVNPEGSAGATPPGALPGGKGLSSNEAGMHMNADGSAFVKLVLPKRDIFVGESVPVDIELGLRQGFAQPNGMPTLTGSDFTLNNLTHQPEQITKIVDGKPYAVLTWHSVLAAIKPGQFSLAVETPIMVRVRTAPPRESMLDDMLGDPFLQNLFGASVTKEATIASPAANLKVLELPTDGRPANFTGAVGQFKIAGELSSTSAAAGDPLTLRLHVSGTGNFDRVDSPMLEHVDQWKTYPPKSSFKSADALGNKGEKTFEQPVIASKPGQQTLPPVTFSYFDPVARQYQTAHTSAFEVSISPALGDGTLNAASPAGAGGPGVAAVAAPGAAQDGLRPDHAETGAGATKDLSPLYLRPSFLALPSLLALAFAAGWAAQRRRAAPRPPRNRRARLATQAAEQRLLKLKSAAQAGNARVFLALAREALAIALADRWQIPEEQITPAELDARLGATGTDADVRQLFALADEAQYSGHAPTHIDFDHWQAVVRGQMSVVPEAGPRSAAALVVLGVVMTGWGLAPPPAAAANAESAGYTAAALYNEGNAYARAGKPGLAVLNYQRARLLTPHDADLEANLNSVRSAAHLAGDSPGTVARAVTSIDATAAAWLGVAGVLLLGTGVLIQRRRGARRASLVVGGLLVALTLAHGAALWRTVHAAVVLSAATPARVSPVPMGDPLFVLPEGETVAVLAMHEDFLLIKTQAGRSGWVSRATVATVVPPAPGAAPRK